MKINNIDDLKSEIARLSLIKTEQEAYLHNQYDLLKSKFTAPMRIANSIFSSIPGVGLAKNLLSKKQSGSSKSDWLTRSLQLGLPVVLNRTLLKNAGWIKKGLVLLASETAARQVNQNKVGSVLGKLSDFIRPKKKKVKNKMSEAVDNLQEQIDEGAAKMEQGIESSRENVQDGLDHLKTKLD